MLPLLVDRFLQLALLPFACYCAFVPACCSLMVIFHKIEVLELSAQFFCSLFFFDSTNNQGLDYFSCGLGVSEICFMYCHKIFLQKLNFHSLYHNVFSYLYWASQTLLLGVAVIDYEVVISVRFTLLSSSNDSETYFMNLDLRYKV